VLVVIVLRALGGVVYDIYVYIYTIRTQVLVVIVHCALVGFARPPYSTKYATREEKVLSALGRVEVTYLRLPIYICTFEYVCVYTYVY